MPDITMCNGISKDNTTCKMKESCYRHTAIASDYRQSYFVEAPFMIAESDEFDCDFYWKTKEDK